MLLTEAVQSIANSMSALEVDQAAIEEVRTNLLTTIELLSGDSFGADGGIQSQSYGDVASATSLSYHHQLAHTVMDEVLVGLNKDLTTFAANLAKAAAGIDQADDTAGSDLKARQQLVEDLTYASTHSHAPVAPVSSGGDH